MPKPKVRYGVYERVGGVKKFLGTTVAVSREEAMSNVRFREYGPTPADKLPPMEACEEEEIPRRPVSTGKIKRFDFPELAESGEQLSFF